MGTPDFAVKSLEKLIQNFPKSTLTVFSQIDKERGRGKQKSPTPVKAFALKHQLEVHTPHDKTELETLVQHINPESNYSCRLWNDDSKTITEQYVCLNTWVSTPKIQRRVSNTNHIIKRRHRSRNKYYQTYRANGLGVAHTRNIIYTY